MSEQGSLMRNLENMEAMLDEIAARVAFAVPSEGERSYIESGIRTAKNDLYQAMRKAVGPHTHCLSVAHVADPDNCACVG